MVEILDHAPADWTSSERLVALAIAEHANDQTRIGYPGMELLTHRLGVDDKSVSRLLRQLSRKGYELRVPAGADKKGRVVFATRSHRSTYRLPLLCPNEIHNTTTCLKRVAVSPPNTEDKTPKSGEERVAVSPPIPEQRVAVSPPNSRERVACGSQRVAIWPPLPLSTPQNPSPQAGGSTAEASTTRKDWGTLDRRAKEDLEKVAEPLRTIFASLLESDPNVTRQEAQAVLTYIAQSAISAGNPIRGVKYYSAMARDGFSAQLATVRAQRLVADDAAKADAQAAVKEQLAELRRTGPDCQHGTAAGNALHPVTGEPLCPSCRAGIPAKQSTDTQAAADRGRVATAYRAAWDAAGHEPIEMTTLATISAEARQMLADGRTLDELLQLAAPAAKARNTLSYAERLLQETNR